MRNFILAALFLSTTAFGSYFLSDGSVTTVKIADANVTKPKLAALGQITSGTVNFLGTSSSYADITGASVSITTTGRPVMVFFSGPSTGVCAFSVDTGSSGAAAAQGSIQMLRGATVVGQYQAVNSIPAALSAQIRLDLPCSAFMWFDTPVAGTYTYKAQYKAASGTTFSITGLMTAFEL